MECTHMSPYVYAQTWSLLGCQRDKENLPKPWMPEAQRLDTNICKVWLWWRAKGSGSFQGHFRARAEEAFRVDQGEEVCELFWLLVWVPKGQILEGRVMWEEPGSGREHGSSWLVWTPEPGFRWLLAVRSFSKLKEATIQASDDFHK